MIGTLQGPLIETFCEQSDFPCSEPDGEMVGPLDVHGTIEFVDAEIGTAFSCVLNAMDTAYVMGAIEERGVSAYEFMREALINHA